MSAKQCSSSSWRWLLPWPERRWRKAAAASRAGWREMTVPVWQAWRWWSTRPGWPAITDTDGSFRFAGVPAGTYSLSFTIGDHSDSASRGRGRRRRRPPRSTRPSTGTSAFAETITVISASRRIERIVDAPAAVTVVTEQEIEREAAHGQLPKLLEFTPGAEVTQSGVYDFNFNTRGFNSSLNRRVATLDRRARSCRSRFSAPRSGRRSPFALDDLASAELVRGPSAALYGANASSGVLNLVTKQPRVQPGRAAAADRRRAVDLQRRLPLGDGARRRLVREAAGRGAQQRRLHRLAPRRRRVHPALRRRGQTPTACRRKRCRSTRSTTTRSAFYGLRFDKYLGNGAALTFEGGSADVSEGPAFQTGIGRVQLVDVDAAVGARQLQHRALERPGLPDDPRRARARRRSSSGANLVLDTERTRLRGADQLGLRRRQGAAGARRLDL